MAATLTEVKAHAYNPQEPVLLTMPTRPVWVACVAWTSTNGHRASHRCGHLPLAGSAYCQYHAQGQRTAA